jgi:transposase-like protein
MDAMVAGMAGAQRTTPVPGPERRTDERSEAVRSAGAGTGGAEPGGGNGKARVPASEVSSTARRRRFTAEYKLGILAAVEVARKSGGIGALLRREGLFSSHLTKWNAQREAGALKALAPRRRGPGAAPRNPLARRVAELERENRRLQRRLSQSEAILEIQKKVSELLGIPLDRPGTDGRTS